MNDAHRSLVQRAVDRRLSGLEGDPLLAQRILLNTQGKEPIMKKKLSVGLAFALVITVLSVGALAASLLFSPRYDAAKLANETLEKQYGITDKMMTALYRQAEQKEDGSTVYTYQSFENIGKIGAYTVTVKDNKATAVWSLDGTDTSGGLEAKAWGPEQLNMMLTDYPAVMTYLSQQKDAYTATNLAPPPSMTPEEAEIAKAEVTALVLKAADITLQQAFENAREAVITEYSLTEEQQALLMGDTDSTTYKMDEERPLVSLFFHLSQGDEWIEKDGIYVVTINMKTGEIEEIIYDSGLAANG